MEEYFGCSTSILLGGGDGKFLACSSIRLSLLGTNKTFIFLDDLAHTMLPCLAWCAGISLEDAAALYKYHSRMSSKCYISLAMSVYKRYQKKGATKGVQRENVQQGLYLLYNMLETRRGT